MTTSGSESPPVRLLPAHELRRHAIRARRLADEVTDRNLHARLVEYATELDAEAAAKEKGLTATETKKAEPLRMATVPVIREGENPVTAQAVRGDVPSFTSKTEWLVREAERVVKQSVSVQRWQMPVRTPFARTAVARSS